MSKKKAPVARTTAHITLIVDRSGSMMNTLADAAGGIQAFLDEQKALTDVDIKVTLCQFDHEFQVVYRDQNLIEVPPYKLEPRGMTALLDAIGRGVLSTTAYADKTLVVIVTDGQENSSQEFDMATVQSLIKNRQEVGWEFVFLAADLDSIELGRQLNLNTTRYDNDRDGTRAVYGATATASAGYLSGRTATVETPEEV